MQFQRYVSFPADLKVGLDELLRVHAVSLTNIYKST